MIPDDVPDPSTGVVVAAAPSGTLGLLVIGEHHVATHALPDGGPVTIGRSSSCDVHVDDPSVSRRHATLHVGATIEIEDLGSVNGTSVRGNLLARGQRAALAIGEPAHVGGLTLIVQQRATSQRPRRIWPHGYFEGRLEEECLRAERDGHPFTVLRVHAASPGAAAAIDRALADVLRQVDVVGCYSPGDYEVLLVDATAADAATIGARLKAHLGAHGAATQVGVAQYGADGISPDELITAAGLAARGGPPPPAPIDPLVAPGSAMQRVHHLIDRVAPSLLSVLILGETGVGKELLAETIHRRSPRAARPFLRLNCAALSETLIESELFGYERGAFTGATQAKAGLLETADQGTVFLDEVGELPLTTQTKLLRVLEDRQVLRVGGLRAQPIDVRFVAATNRDLEAEVARGTFRQDLFFRLNGITLELPPLRERTDEIEGLARRFLAEASGRIGVPAPRLPAAILDLLRRYAWPGNIRELRNVMERAALLCDGPELAPAHLPMEKLRVAVVVRTAAAPPRPGRRRDRRPGDRHHLDPRARRRPQGVRAGRARAHRRGAAPLRRQPDPGRRAARDLAPDADQPARGVRRGPPAQAPGRRRRLSGGTRTRGAAGCTGPLHTTCSAMHEATRGPPKPAIGNGPDA